MSDYKEVVKNITKLESMMPGILSFGKPDLKAMWAQIRETGHSFKGANFPSKDEHQEAWNRFQRLVERVKEEQQKNQKEWDKKKDSSSRFRDAIIAKAHEARPYDSAVADLILNIATGGINAILHSIMGPFDEEKEMLISCGKILQRGWDMLHDNKDQMLGGDKKLAFEALNETKVLLDQRWQNYKIQRQKAFDKYQQENERKHQAWKQRIKDNIRNLEERLDKLLGVLAHKERHLEELHDKLRDAWSDDYRSNVSSWIYEEESNIKDIKHKICNIEEWIYQNREKLCS